MAPNILWVIVDDLPRDVLKSMEFTKAEIRDKGALYVNGTIVSPLCGISRASLLTGKYAHNHGVWANRGEYGGWEALAPHEPTALPVRLQAAGYRTGLFGKYTNGWVRNSFNVTGTVPPGWNRFRAIDPDSGGDGDYYNYTLVGTGNPEHHGSAPEDYSTDVVAARAAQFIANTDPSVPFFCYFSPFGTHGNFTPAPRHLDTYPVQTIDDLNPAVNSDNSLRAPWLRTKGLQDVQKILDIYKAQNECVMSVDEGIATIFEAIGEERLVNTLIMVIGDNGLQRGEQRLMGKNIGYPGSTNVPMVARWDGHIAPGTKVQEVVTNLDYTATVVDAAGASMPDLDGVVAGTNTSGVLLEGMTGEPDGHPSWIGWKTRNWLYLNYGAGQGEELYKIICDKNAITNVAAEYPDKVQELRYKATSAANPLPPGFNL